MPNSNDPAIYKGFQSADPAHPAMNVCFKCKHAQPVPGSSHHQLCKSPYATPEAAMAVIMLTLAGQLDVSGFEGIDDNKRMVFRANQRGAEQGWFMWPIDFDPVWLIECGFFEPKTDETDANPTSA